MVIQFLKIKSLLNNHQILLIIFFGFIINGCSHTQHQLNRIDHSENDGLETKIVSYSGVGEVHSTGKQKGALKFTFHSQNDSTVIQFRDFLGRKTIIMWIENNSIYAWDILQNNTYTQQDIEIIIPQLVFINPSDITYFLTGNAQNVELNMLDQSSKNVSIEISINDVDSSDFAKKDEIILKRLDQNSELIISVHERKRNQSKIPIKKYWKAKPIQS